MCGINRAKLGPSGAIRAGSTRAGSEAEYSNLAIATVKMPKFCVVYGFSNRSNREKNKRFFRVPKVVVHRGDKYKKLSEQRRKNGF
uniref:Zgc:113019 n=1 Tax=Nothobranchius pienaari TaxID=704102 RepID=A0A1A8MN14_9TELE